MKAAVLTGLKEMEIREYPDPVLVKDTDVLMKVERVGVCGSDVHYYTTGRIGDQVVQYPYRVGHECSATIREIGSAVTRVKVGDRVAVDPAEFCGECDQCKVGRFHTCRNLSFLGTPGQGEGCLCEYVVMSEKCCFPIRADMSLDCAALIEPLSIGVYAVDLSVPMKGKRIAILGAGPIGLSVLLPAVNHGAAKVYVTDKIDRRLEVARSSGASWVGNPDKMDIVAGISAKEPGLLDCVFECCGQQDALDQAIELLKPGGKLVLVGIPEVDRVSFSIDQIRRKEICIQNVRRQNECVQAAIDLVEKQGVDVSFMITHHFTLDQAKEAFDLVHAYEDGVVKAMIDISG